MKDRLVRAGYNVLFVNEEDFNRILKDWWVPGHLKGYVNAIGEDFNRILMVKEGRCIWNSISVVFPLGFDLVFALH